MFYTRRQHTQLEIIVNNKRFTEAEGVKHHMTGLQIAALVSENPRNTEVFKLLKKGEPEPVPLDKEICIENCDEFRVIRNNIAGGFVEPTRIERELEKLKQGGCRVDFVQQPFPAVIYRDVPTRPGYRHLQMTDVLVIVPGGYPGQPLDGAHLPKALRCWAASQVRHKASSWRTGGAGSLSVITLTTAAALLLGTRTNTDCTHTTMKSFAGFTAQMADAIQ